jgi:hypothetical protein
MVFKKIILCVLFWDLFFFWDSVLLCNPGCSRTWDSPASASWVLGLHVWNIRLNWDLLFSFFNVCVCVCLSVCVYLGESSLASFFFNWWHLHTMDIKRIYLTIPYWSILSSFPFFPIKKTMSQLILFLFIWKSISMGNMPRCETNRSKSTPCFGFLSTS